MIHVIQGSGWWVWVVMVCADVGRGARERYRYPGVFRGMGRVSVCDYNFGFGLEVACLLTGAWVPGRPAGAVRAAGCVLTVLVAVPGGACGAGVTGAA